ncbi:unnamed protein product [Rhizopus stolonifer]
MFNITGIKYPNTKSRSYQFRNNAFWSLSSSLAFHETHMSHIGLGQISANSAQCIFGRLDYHSRFSRTINVSYSSRSSETARSRMTRQLQEIDIDPKSGHRVPRFPLEHHSDDCKNTGKETTRRATFNNPQQSPRTIHSLTMGIQAATFAVLPARMYAQYLLRLKSNAVKSFRDWDRSQSLTSDCLKELTG